ncbi:protein RETICULATA-RELATED 1, chloroplastic [Ziziphus jujuba]|uniref:Protein RETICULATA-RELATED 1, chloroplastic n=1 Tax=Ziziphus jujuba TaxID=326968 RepID=A0A6P4ABA2_ZIZJJ|nr:protein RETICULATA-RELATED 1, chloroplastic [Ziziphus jujuba]
MSHAVFQTAQIMPINTQLPVKHNSLSSVSLSSPKLVCPNQLVTAQPAGGKHRRGGPVVKAFVAPPPSSSSSSSSGGLVDGDSMTLLERCFAAPSVSGGAPASSSLGPVMKGQYGAFGAVTLEKGKLDMSQKQSKSSPETAVGGGGGDIGKKINHGGGDGGDDDGDDDDYFDDFDDGDEGDEGGLFRRRKFLEELFDRKFVDAVLNEWQKTFMDLPAGFRQAYEMGLVSSAQMVKFLAINARPTTTRFISRSLPQAVSRAFIGRMLADPAFLYKLLLEQAATIGFSVWSELKNRKDRIKQEWDLALVNVLTVAACNAIVVWSLAPCRSYGNTFRFDLQNTLQKLPNNIFERSYPLREFDLQKRIHSFFYKAAELCMVGLTAGAVQGSLSNYLASKKEGRLSVSIPSTSTNALGYGAFLGLYANMRYQLLCGYDRAMFNHFDVIGVALFFSTALRVLNVQLGEASRLAWLGVEPDPLAHSDDLLKVYNRPSQDADQLSSKWFISKSAIVSGLGLLGIKQGNVDSVADGESPAPRARRKRIVRKKVTTSS